MRGNVINLKACVLFLLLGLYGCGGGGSTPAPGPVSTATGVFIDAPVEGLKYVSGGHSGLTNEKGEFIYEVGKPVTFSVGGVVIGQSLGASTITPIDLVKTATAATDVAAGTPAVVQIAQFLLTASSLTQTGIAIDPAVTTACDPKKISINLSTASSDDFNTAISQIALAAGNRSVTTAADAQNHITASMAALSSGTLVLPVPSITGGGSLNKTPVSLAGSWLNNTNKNVVLTIYDSGFYILANATTPSNSSGQAGVQAGTYTFYSPPGSYTLNSLTGSFASTAYTFNTMGSWGLPLNTASTLSITSTTMTVSSTTDTYTRITANAASPLIGSWIVDNNKNIVLTILDKTTYILVQATAADSFGQPGVQAGTYTYISGIFTPTSRSVNTMGNWGFNVGSPITLTTYGDTMISAPIIHTFTRFQ